MLPNRREPATPPLVLRLLGSVVAFQRQAHQQLRSAQAGPSLGGRVQGGGEVIGLGHEVTGASRRHTGSVTLAPKVLHRFWRTA